MRIPGPREDEERSPERRTTRRASRRRRSDGGHAQPAVQGAHADHQRRGQPEAGGERHRPAAGDGLAVERPITIYINSQGGHVESGDTIHDMVRYVRSPVRMVGTGWVASAGALIYVAVPRERRFSLPHTRYLLHQPAGGMRGSAADIEIEAREILNMRERLNQVFAERTARRWSASRRTRGATSGCPRGRRGIRPGGQDHPARTARW
jgi:hypothetical protein